MSIQILMPTLTSDMKAGAVAKWLCEEGSLIKAGQPIAEIETDDGLIVFKADEDGRILKILKPASVVPIETGTPIALVEENEESGKPRSFAETLSSVTKENGFSKISVSPLARRVAEQAGVDLSRVSGSGPSGRIVLSDVEIFIANIKTGKVRDRAAADTPSVVSSSASRSFVVQPSTLSAASTQQDRGASASALSQASSSVPLLQTKSMAASACLFDEVDLGALQALRQSFAEKHGKPLSLQACLIRALALALKKIPECNAVYLDDTVIANGHAHVAFALAGYAVRPVLRDADAKSLDEIETLFNDLSVRAEQDDLRADEKQDASLTLVDLSESGLQRASLPLFAPQSCLLAVGGVTEKSVGGRGTRRPTQLVSFALSFDPRVMDAFMAASFLSAIKKGIEQPYALVV